VEVHSITAIVTPEASSQSRITSSARVVVGKRPRLPRRPRGPGVRTHTVSVALPISRPATRSNSTTTGDPSSASTPIGAARSALCQDTDPRAHGSNQGAPEDPAPYTSAGSPAPLCSDVAGRQEQFSSARAAIKIATVTPLR
jgi:hypothetical protein